VAGLRRGREGHANSIVTIAQPHTVANAYTLAGAIEPGYANSHTLAQSNESSYANSRPVTQSVQPSDAIAVTQPVQSGDT